MKVGVAKETAPGERRVALVPEALGKLQQAGLEILVEQGAGAGSAIPDSAYADAGATVVPTDQLYQQADAILRVAKPSAAEAAKLRPGQAVLGLLQPLIDPGAAKGLADLGVTAISLDTNIFIVLDIIIGSITFTGSIVAAGKLQGVIPGKPIIVPGGQLVTLLLAGVTLLAAGFLFVTGTPNVAVMLVILAAALIFGVTMTLPIGGADMPVVISLLNSFTGTAVAMAGFVIDNPVLIIAGALVGASGAILTKLMADAMNRSVMNIMIGGFGGGEGEAGAAGAEGGTVRSIGVDDVAIQLAYAQSVIVVPGYGMAVAQAQHAVRELADLLEEKGVDVKYAIHPVAGRMPGHMNVLLAEANVPYPQLKEMEDINPEFSRADVALVIGANDVTNPAARRPGSPVSGMPILDVDQARSIVVIKRSMGRGYAGIDNELYTNEKTGMLFADAKEGLAALTAAVKAL